MTTGPLEPETLRLAHQGLVALVVVERGIELALSRRNAARVRGRGGIEIGAGHYPVMVLLHASFLVCCVLEPVILEREIRPALFATMLGVLGLSMALRYWAIAALGDRWNTRVLVEPGIAPVSRGPYRYLAHPNYVAVVLEIAALPLAGSAWATAVLFSALNAAMLRVRIRVEERALHEHCGWRAESALEVGAREQSR